MIVTFGGRREDGCDTGAVKDLRSTSSAASYDFEEDVRHVRIVRLQDVQQGREMTTARTTTTMMDVVVKTRLHWVVPRRGVRRHDPFHPLHPHLRLVLLRRRVVVVAVIETKDAVEGSDDFFVIGIRRKTRTIHFYMINK